MLINFIILFFMQVYGQEFKPCALCRQKINQVYFYPGIKEHTPEHLKLIWKEYHVKNWISIGNNLDYLIKH